MAVTSFDGQFSFKQDSLARLGSRSNHGKMSAEQYKQFQDSPFMKGVRKTEELCWEFTCSRDQLRARNDPSFKPQDTDFSAQKAFAYDKAVNYYKVLGIDEYAPLDEVKKAYKKLSLVYHPDKTAGLDQQQKDEYAEIFMELKNAYQTLGDHPTRRQYDRDRDRDKASHEINGYKIKEKKHFNAAEVLAKLAEKKSVPGKTINLNVSVKLEKFFYGGHKAIERERKVKDWDGFKMVQKIYRIDVPRGAPEGIAATFNAGGDHHEDTRPDTIKFQVTSKPHQVVQRQRDDLVVRGRLQLPQESSRDPFLDLEAPSVNGRHVLLWGRNPFYVPGCQRKGPQELQVRLHGEGLTQQSFFRVVYSTHAAAVEAVSDGAASAPVAAAAPSKPPTPEGGEERILVCARNLQTEAKIYLLASETDTILQLRRRINELLGLSSSTLRILKKLSGNRGFTPFADSQELGSMRELSCAGHFFDGVPMPPERCLAFLRAISKGVETAVANGAQSEAAIGRHLIWILPEYGYKPDLPVLEERVRYAMANATKRGDFEELKKQLLERMRPRGPGEGVQMGAAGQAGANGKNGTAAPARMSQKRFLLRHSLGPPQGFAGAGSDTEEEKERGASAPAAGKAAASTAQQLPLIHGRGGACEAQAIQRRLRRQTDDPVVCEVVLTPLGEPVTLFSKPTCSITFFSNGKQAVETGPGRVRPRAMFAVVLSSPACMRGRALREWSALRGKLVPVLKASAFRLLQSMRSILPRPLARTAFEWAALGEAEEASPPAVPWKRLGDDAFKRGDSWVALRLYGRCLEELPEDEDDELRATLLSNRSACFAKVRDFQAALSEARGAIERRPKWGKAWSRAGLAALSLGPNGVQEAFKSYMSAVEFDPCGANIDALATVALKAHSQPNAERAHEEKESGNQALRMHELGLALAHYTVGIALLPPEETAVDSTGAKLPDSNALLRSVLYSNRAAVFCRLQNWKLGVEDARKAVAAKGEFAKARCRLGMALLGARLVEQAYSEFSRALSLEVTNSVAAQGRQTCLATLPLWKSVLARKRHRDRFAIDISRPLGSTSVYAISDVFFDHKANEDWVHSIDDMRFVDDVLIVAGNLCDTRNALKRALVTLKAKFRRVFYVPGNHEMYVAGEVAKYPDSIAKLLSIFELCDELEVDIFPAAVCQGVFVVPMLSWYNVEFDVADPFPNTVSENVDSLCRWPIDKDLQVWKYMLKLNEVHLRHLYHGTVVTFSHFLPTTRLPMDRMGKGGAKVIGCEAIDEQLRAVNSNVHIFGHTRRHHWATDRGVIYANHYHGLEGERSQQAQLLRVFNGWSVPPRPETTDIN